MNTIKMKRGATRGDPSRGFYLEILYPGLTFGEGDSGIGAIGRIDRARPSGSRHRDGPPPRRRDPDLRARRIDDP